MIGIGVDYRGAEYLDRAFAIRPTLDNAMKLVAALRAPNFNDGTAPWITPIFIVPGSLSKPDFEGLKLGQFSRKTKGLVVLIAVPETVALGEGSSEFIITSLRSAARIAAVQFGLKKMYFSLEDAEGIIARIEAGMAPPSKLTH